MIETLLIAKEKFAQMGISPNDFRKTRMRDILDVLDLSEAWRQKSERERKIQEAMSSMKR